MLVWRIADILATGEALKSGWPFPGLHIRCSIIFKPRQTKFQTEKKLRDLRNAAITRRSLNELTKLGLCQVVKHVITKTSKRSGTHNFRVLLSSRSDGVGV